MPFLPSTSLLHGLGLNHEVDTCRSTPASKSPTQRRLRATSSLANLVQFARNPVGIASEAVEDWYDGSTKDERTQRQALADRKQLLYLKMRTVSLASLLRILQLLIHHP